MSTIAIKQILSRIIKIQLKGSLIGFAHHSPSRLLNFHQPIKKKLCSDNTTLESFINKVMQKLVAKIIENTKKIKTKQNLF